MIAADFNKPPLHGDRSTPSLLLISEHQDTQRFPIGDLAPVIIGRAAATQLRIDEDNVSRRHARITRVDSAYFIDDLNSTNGTYLNGYRLKTTRKLCQGDLIGIGKTLLTFVAPGGAPIQQPLTALVKRLRFDPLTELTTRAFFVQQLCSQFAGTVRGGDTVCLLLCDLDNFTAINTVYGRAEGDKALRKIAQKVRACVRQNRDFVARYSDETFFAIIMPQAAPELAALVAEKIRMSVARLQLRFGDRVSTITLSIGGGASGDSVTTPEALLALAEANLRRAKQNGKNRVEI